ncbi:MAG: DM13 domain-containing protein [Dehalococcoidia bacterium]|nr:DM13 domain-containing protein [Dehalococcoidia bacterium]
MTLKKTLIGVAVIVVIAGAAFAWWLLSPLFLNTTVEEEFPFSATADMPVGMTQTEAEDIMQGMAKVDMEEMEEMPDEMAQAVALSSGMFRDADSFHKGSGTATIYRLPDGMGALRFENLDVTNGPDLRVLLSTHPDPQNKAELNEAGYIHIEKLKGNRGNQNYELPADADLESFGSVIIYCMPFHVIFSVAPLQ